MAEPILNHPMCPEIRLPDEMTYPSIAATPEELARLRAVYQGTGKDRDVIVERITQADRLMNRPLVFPPEGGQHNQWYQCEKCQIGLKTVDATHHKCPKCGAVYRGYPYDNVLYKTRHGQLAHEMAVCGWAYAVTDDSTYAERARDLLLGYAERYQTYPYHSNSGKRTDKPRQSGGHVMEQTLSESSWVLNVCEAYDLVRTSGVFSEADHQKIKQDLLVKVAENIDKYKAGKSNWQTYHNAAMFEIGAMVGDVGWMKKALEDPDNGFYRQMDISVLPGGMWYENSWGYHFYPLEAVRRTTESARRLGMDLYWIPQLKEMYTVALDYQMIDGTLPRFADSVTMRIPGSRYETAFHQWGDAAFLTVLPQEPTWDSVLYGRTIGDGQVGDMGQFKSILKEGAGHAILRVNGPEGPASAVLTYGPFGGGHGHFDKLSFVYFALGQEQGYDPGRAKSQAYRLPVHKNWYRATTSHNTVLVDRKSQEGVEGQLELFVSNEAVSAAAASVDNAYEGIEHHRLLILRPGFLVSVDILNATDGQDHTFDWLYHNRGDAIACDQVTAVEKTPEGQGFEFIEDTQAGLTDGTVFATVQQGDRKVHILVNGEPGSEVLTGTGVGESVLDRVPLVFVTRKGQGAKFASVIDPSSEGGDVTDVTIEGDALGGYVVRVTLGDGASEIYGYDPNGSKREVEGQETTAKLLGMKKDQRGTIQTFVVSQ